VLRNVKHSFPIPFQPGLDVGGLIPVFQADIISLILRRIALAVAAMLR
jgi:hypothetical protein